MKSESVTVADMLLRQVMSDLSLRYAQAPLHRIRFDLDAAGLTRLAEHYRPHVFRLNRNLEQGTMTTNVVLLRFGEDVFVYLGDLDPELAAAARALAPGGVLGFTAQSHGGDGVRLGADLRFSHSAPAVRASLARAGLIAGEGAPASTRRRRRLT